MIFKFVTIGGGTFRHGRVYLDMPDEWTCELKREAGEGPPEGEAASKTTSLLSLDVLAFELALEWSSLAESELCVLNSQAA